METMITDELISEIADSLLRPGKIWKQPIHILQTQQTTLKLG